MVHQPAHDSAALIRGQVSAHDAASDEDYERLRALSMAERAAMLESACAAAIEIVRSRQAAGLPPIEPDPWPASTWEFLRKHAARGQT
ncbi:MAG: hypothetical protein JW719_09030 [Pirellulales bacterium]|nr:hypothetical protein [Pirellulales bacterium]